MSNPTGDLSVRHHLRTEDEARADGRLRAKARMDRYADDPQLQAEITLGVAQPLVEELADIFGAWRDAGGDR